MAKGENCHVIVDVVHTLVYFLCVESKSVINSYLTCNLTQRNEICFFCFLYVLTKLWNKTLRIEVLKEYTFNPKWQKSSLFHILTSGKFGRYFLDIWQEKCFSKECNFSKSYYNK